MNEELDRALAALHGLPLVAMARVGDMFSLRFGTDDVSAYAMLVACPWRIADGERILVGSGDLLTPADPDADLETFDWDAPGASWLDVRLDELRPELESGAMAVVRATADAFGGVRLELSRGWRVELFPSSTPTGHVTTEFWRLAGGDGAQLVIGTFGINRE
jgi:hypothetical protein